MRDSEAPDGFVYGAQSVNTSGFILVHVLALEK